MIRYWVFISLLYTIQFSWTWLLSLVKDLYNSSRQDAQKVKIKSKPLGAYAENDPKRTLVMRESIYSLAFAANMQNTFLQSKKVPSNCRPTTMQRAEVNLTAFICAFCQIFTSILLLQDFIKMDAQAEA